MLRNTLLGAITLGIAAAACLGQSTDPRIACWVYNIDGRHGVGGNTAINNIVSAILADTQQVRYDTNYVYINATSIPSYSVGPFPTNPNTPANQNAVFRIPRTPTVPATHTATGLGSIGVLINGVTIFNAKDGMSYQNANVWHQNAYYFEAISFDSALGHPQQTGVYHHHVKPTSLLTQLGDRPDVHSPLIGYAFDGIPIYGPYAYTNSDGTGPIKRMASSYRLRSITSRTSGPAIGPSNVNANGTYSTTGPQPLGAYIEDYEFVSGLGDLDQYNGRLCVTPEFPAGQYCYFITLDASGTPAYPYIVGPSYYGTFVSQAGVTVPAGVSSQAFSAEFPCTTIFAQLASVSNACPGGTASFSVKVRYGGAAQYQWRKGGAVLTNVGRVSGVNSGTLTITGLTAADAGSYDCLITNPSSVGTCGPLTTSAATLGVCVADYNCDASVTVQDVFDFIGGWFGGAALADVNASGSLTVQDIFDFLTAWFNGC